jgi:hypothetical protein
MYGRLPKARQRSNVTLSYDRPLDVLEVAYRIDGDDDKP